MSSNANIVPLADEQAQCDMVSSCLRQYVKMPESLEDAHPGSTAIIAMHLKRCTKCQQKVCTIYDQRELKGDDDPDG